MARVQTLSRWLIAAGLVVMSITGFASNQLLDEDAFASLISNSVDSPEVRKMLAQKAIDVAIDASNADAQLAAALPEELSLIATPALELSKPAIAEAGAQLLGVDAVGATLETAARSIHRQTSGAILAEDEAHVVINTLPVLVVVADEIAGDVGARAAVGLDLPESATTIDLGSNQSTVWTVVRSLSYVAAGALLLWLLSMVSYFVSAGRGRRLAAARRLGRTFINAGLTLAVLTWLLLLVTAAALEVTLASGDTLSFAGVSFGGFSDGGGIALAEVIFDPLLGSGRRTIFTGLGLILVTYLMGSGPVAQALRASLRRRDLAVVRTAMLDALPGRVRHVQRALAAGLVVALILWPQITLRPALTLTLLVVGAFVVLAVLTGASPLATTLRRSVGWSSFAVLDLTERSDRASGVRRGLFPIAVLVALIWPSYDASGFVSLIVLLGAGFALTYWWELKPADAAEDVLALNAQAASAWPRRRKVIVGIAVLAGIGLIGFGGDNASPANASMFAAGQPTVCNGHAALCDRPVDQVVFAGTHNSMSASDLGWELANHRSAIPAQLAGGIRALLIDVQYWPQADSIDSLDLDPQAAKIAAAALAVDTPPEDGLWMCHQLCQLGGTPFEDFLADLRAFLETNPDEVLIIVIQDDAPARDITTAIEAAGVDEYAYAHQPGTGWPTLGEMIETKQRLIFLAENDVPESGQAQADDDAVGWYQLAFEGNVSESGFRYSVIEDFDCAESRGGNDGAFFMINHWVETGLPVPSEADRVNSRDVLLDRVRGCEQTRNRRPGIIAVNFWERGDLLAVVKELNLVDS